MPILLVPGSLARLFPGMPRSITVTGDTVAACISDGDIAWPGLRDRLCISTGEQRPHILLFVDGQPAMPSTPVSPASEIMVVPALTGG